MNQAHQPPGAAPALTLRINRHVATSPQIAVLLTRETRTRMWHDMLQARRTRLTAVSAGAGAPMGGDAA